MKNKLIVIALIALAIIGLGKLKQYWDSRKDVITAPVLTEAEKSKVIIDTSKKRVTIVKRDGDKQVRRTIKGVRHIATTENIDGTISHKFINRGFLFEPGLILGTDSNDGLIGIDTQWFYWSDWGLTSGLSVPYDTIRFNKLRVHVAFSYNLNIVKMNNTYLYAGIDTAKQIVFGTRISF